MDIPKLKQNQCSVLIAEHSSGIIYKKDFTVYRNSKITNDVFEIFESYTQAEEFVKNFL
jgi:zona occludens toxin (predicted ATPase)